MLLPLLAAALLSPAQDAPAPAPAPAAKPEKPQCRRMAAATGSMMPSKPVCHTKAEWAAIDGSNGSAADHLRSTMNNAGRSNY